MYEKSCVSIQSQGLQEGGSPSVAKWSTIFSPVADLNDCLPVSKLDPDYLLFVARSGSDDIPPLRNQTLMISYLLKTQTLMTFHLCRTRP